MYTVKVFVNEEEVDCVCPPESCDVFCARTGLEKNLERGAKIKLHHEEPLSTSGKSRAAAAASSRLVLM